jgi:hypothetical protein
MNDNNVNYVSPDEVNFVPSVGAEVEEGYFLITTVCRQDIDQALLEERVFLRDPTLTDEVMRKVAEKLNTDYMNQLFWSSLREAVHAVVDQKEFLPIKSVNDDLPYEEYCDGG